VPGNIGLIALFRALKIAGPVELKPGPLGLAARIRGPRGDVELR
jgi:hypothetical protein